MDDVRQCERCRKRLRPKFDDGYRLCGKCRAVVAALIRDQYRGVIIEAAERRTEAREDVRATKYGGSVDDKSGH